MIKIEGYPTISYPFPIQESIQSGKENKALPIISLKHLLSNLPFMLLISTRILTTV